MTRFLLILFILVAFVPRNNSDEGCKPHATILRRIEREGFHIDISSLIELVVDLEAAKRWENCSIILRETITSSFFVNPDQLSELNRSGVTQACTLDKINIEKPQHSSNGHTVFLYGRLKRSQNLVYANLNFPLHMRYHKPKVNGGYSLGELKSPILLFNCPNIDCKNLLISQAPCHLCGSQICAWKRLPYKANNHNMTLPVPVGNLNHLWFIRPLTYLLTYGGCLYVIITILSNN